MPDIIQIRKLEEADLEPLLEIERAVYPRPWSEQVFQAELSREAGGMSGAIYKGELIGYGSLMLVDIEAHINSLVVKPEWRGRQVGPRLLLELVEKALQKGATSLTLEVRASNQVAQSLYFRFGLAPVGVRKQYYQTEDGLIMWAHDIDQPEYRHRLDRIRAQLDSRPLEPSGSPPVSTAPSAGSPSSKESPIHSLQSNASVSTVGAAFSPLTETLI